MKSMYIKHWMARAQHIQCHPEIKSMLHRNYAVVGLTSSNAGSPGGLFFSAWLEVDTTYLLLLLTASKDHIIGVVIHLWCHLSLIFLKAQLIISCCLAVRKLWWHSRRRYR